MVSQLIERHKVKVECIGRIEVGTETIMDKSKSVKSYLMQLFPGISDMSGVDCLNACYGGTAALFNSVAWIESADWDGRLAIVVAGDVAVYEKGPARPTGGAGAIAMLIGPDAPLVLERGTVAHFMQHSFDFYKPNPASEYPIVDGQESIFCYYRALDACYNSHIRKIEKSVLHEKVNLNSFNYFVFHSPYGRLVRKSFGRLLLNDAVNNPGLYPELLPYKDVKMESTYGDRELSLLLARLGENIFIEKTLDAGLISSKVGNCYCASLYLGLVSLVSSLAKTSFTPDGQRIGMYSYGSGLASSMFSLLIVGNLESITHSMGEIESLLAQRQRVCAEEFDQVMKQRESIYCSKDWTPSTKPDELRMGSYYLERVDDKLRRFYKKV